MWHRPHLNRNRRREKHRGIALIMVLTAIAIFTAVVVDFTYSSRVELDLAANARDEVRAYFLAKSAVNLSRLVLHFQHQLDNSPLSQMMGGMGGADGPLSSLLGQQAGSSASSSALSALPGMGGLNIQLWKLIPVDSGTVQLFLGGAGVTGPDDDFDDDGGLPPIPEVASQGAKPGSSSAVESRGQIKSFGDFAGSYHADIEDEEAKMNVARLNIPSGAIQQAAIVQALLMFGDKRYQWLYDDDDDSDDVSEVKSTPKDVIINIHDYIDANQTGSALDSQDTVNPFVDSSSDEQEPYSQYKPEYKPKNAPFDSLDELYMVAGVTDRFMAAFRDRLTVYPDINKGIDINTDDPFMMLMNIYMAAANPNDPLLQDPLVIQQIFADLKMLQMFPGMGLTVSQFAAILQANKIAVNPSITTASTQGTGALSDHSETFTIHAEGDVGKVQKRLTAVVRVDDALGQLLYWREE